MKQSEHYSLLNIAKIYLFFKINAPKIILTISPPLLKIMCNGTEMLYPKAKLFSIDTIKNMVTKNSQFERGTTVGFNFGPYLPQMIWFLNPSTATNKNWPNVINWPKNEVNNMPLVSCHIKPTTFWCITEKKSYINSQKSTSLFKQLTLLKLLKQTRYYNILQKLEPVSLAYQKQSYGLTLLWS